MFGKAIPLYDTFGRGFICICFAMRLEKTLTSYLAWGLEEMAVVFVSKFWLWGWQYVFGFVSILFWAFGWCQLDEGLYKVCYVR